VPRASLAAWQQAPGEAIVSEKQPAGAPEGAPRPGATPRITPREQEILGLIAEGLTDQEIAERLWVSRNTVNTHLVHLREKLQVHNRTALVREADRQGLLSLQPEESRVLAIGDEPHLGYTPDQEVAPKPSLEHPGSEASADAEGETEMLNPRLRFWYLAALLAMGAQHGAAPAEPTPSASTSGSRAPSAAVEGNERPARMVIRQVWTHADVAGTVSADGRFISYVDWETGGDLAIRELATGKQRRLTNTGSGAASSGAALESALSPDGTRVAYAWMNKDRSLDLRLVGLDGSEPRVLYRNPEVDYMIPAAWSPDGRQVLALFHRKAGNSQMALVSVADGAVRVLKSPVWPSNVSFSPDGRFITCDFPAQESAPARDIYLLATDAGREIPLIQHPANDLSPIWTPDGARVLFLSDRTGSYGIWSVHVTDGKPDGKPELVKADTGLIRPLGFTQDGSLYYAVGWKEDVFTATLDLKAGRLVAPPQSASPRFVGANTRPAWSPDGRHLAYRTSRGPLVEPPLLSIRSLDSGQVREISFPGSMLHTLQWSADGRSVLVTGRAQGREGAFRINARTGVVTSFPTSERRLSVVAWSRDTRTVFYAQLDADPQSYHLVARNLKTGGEKDLHRGEGQVRSLALSPDGRQLAFSVEDPATGSCAIKAMRAAGGAPSELCGMQEMGIGINIQWNMVRWTPDGRHLLFGWQPKETAELWCVPAAGGKPQRLGVIMPLARHLSVHPDGQQISFSAPMSDGGSGVWVMERFLPTDAAQGSGS
jgi:Tol biopolymer transport system component/DNA-binding CsgD family transcriptional regulator